MTEKDQSALDALMARRNGVPLPEPTCSHLSRDHDGNCWGCADEQRKRDLMARAWLEGWAAGVGDAAALSNGINQQTANPYFPPGPEAVE